MMDNMTYMNNVNAGVSNSTPAIESGSNEAYMSTQAQPEQVVTPVETDKPYTFRKLNSTDLFPMVKIISKIGIDELSTVFEGNFVQKIIEQAKQAQDEKVEQAEQDEKASDDSMVKIGFTIALKLANKILEHIPACESEIYMLLGNVSGMDVEQVKTLDLDVFLSMIIDFIMKDEFKNFFKVASKYIKL